MKKRISLFVVLFTVVCSLAGCGMRDYSFVQEEWDTNDLSFVESTPDPNEAYRFIRYFAQRYEDYRAGYKEAEKEGEYDYIWAGSPTLGRGVDFDYYIMEDEETAKSYYEKRIAKISEDRKTVLSYGDAAIRIEGNEGSSHGHWILDGNCVLYIWPIFNSERVNMAEIEDFLDYMY